MQASLRYFKYIVVLGFDTLKLYVLRYHFIRYIAARRHKVPPSPKVPIPELLPQSVELLQQMMRRLILDRLHHSARSQIRWHAQQQMNVIGPYMALQYLDVVTPADLPYQLPYSQCHVPTQCRLAVLRDKYEVVVQ